MGQLLARQYRKFYAVHVPGEVHVDENHHQRVAQMFHSDRCGLGGFAFDDLQVAFFQEGGDERALIAIVFNDQSGWPQQLSHRAPPTCFELMPQAG